MSLDDAIAISSIISIDGTLNFQKVVVAVIGLIFGALVLLLFSDTMTRLVERFAILNNLCAGYLTYMAIKIIFEDDTIKPFFERINFTFAIPGAALCGILHSNLFAVLCINSPDCIFCKSKGFIAVNKKYLLKKL